uniref:Uncharacterized protein n=1 Tax=Setaria viridis TaxID=4556 RepID=A0A4U6TFB2_SETVI|nr:hypothetical protein SEVIR_8G145350v2 [Setaria viridis]
MASTRSSHPRRLRARAHPGAPLARARIARIPGRAELLPSNSPPISRPASFPSLASHRTLPPLFTSPDFFTAGLGQRERERFM